MKDFYNPKAKAITAGSRVSSSTVREIGFNKLLREDLRLKAMWLYQSDSRVAILKTLLTDGTASMILYRMMQWSRTYRLAPLEMLFNKLNTISRWHSLFDRNSCWYVGWYGYC